MSGIIHFPFYPGDYLADTTHLTTEQHGAYLLLLLHCYTHGSLPDCEKTLMRLTGMSSHKWRKNSKIILKFFEKNGEKFEQKKAKILRQQIQEKSIKAKKSGGLGGRPSKLKKANAFSQKSYPDPEPDPDSLDSRESKQRTLVLDSISKERLVMNYGSDAVNYYEQILSLHIASSKTQVNNFPAYLEKVILRDQRNRKDFYAPDKNKSQHPLDRMIDDMNQPENYPELVLDLEAS